MFALLRSLISWVIWSLFSFRAFSVSPLSALFCFKYLILSLLSLIASLFSLIVFSNSLSAFATSSRILVSSAILAVSSAVIFPSIAWSAAANSPRIFLSSAFLAVSSAVIFPSIAWSAAANSPRIFLSSATLAVSSAVIFPSIAWSAAANSPRIFLSSSFLSPVSFSKSSWPWSKRSLSLCSNWVRAFASAEIFPSNSLSFVSLFVISRPRAFLTPSILVDSLFSSFPLAFFSSSNPLLIFPIFSFMSLFCSSIDVNLSSAACCFCSIPSIFLVFPSIPWVRLFTLPSKALYLSLNSSLIPLTFVSISWSV